VGVDQQSRPVHALDFGVGYRARLRGGGQDRPGRDRQRDVRRPHAQYCSNDWWADCAAACWSIIGFGSAWRCPTHTASEAQQNLKVQRTIKSGAPVPRFYLHRQKDWFSVELSTAILLKRCTRSHGCVRGGIGPQMASTDLLGLNIHRGAASAPVRSRQMVAGEGNRVVGSV